MPVEVAEKTVYGKLRKWYPLPHQRKRRLVVKLRNHMLGCAVCSDSREDLCSYAVKLLVDADIALGLREN